MVKTVCPLCGYRFDPQNACGGCGLAKFCSSVRCPNCNYEFVERSKTVERLGRLLKRWTRNKGGYFNERKTSRDG